MKTSNLIALAIAAGGAALLLTRKSEDEPQATPAPSRPQPAAPMALPPLPKVVLTQLPALDRGLSADEMTAIRNAVTHETLPANLNGFASTFEPMFPVAASVLRAKAAALQTNVSGAEPCCDDCADGKRPPCKGLPCDQQVSGPAIFAGLPVSLVGR